MQSMALRMHSAARSYVFIFIVTQTPGAVDRLLQLSGYHSFTASMLHIVGQAIDGPLNALRFFYLNQNEIVGSVKARWSRRNLQTERDLRPPLHPTLSTLSAMPTASQSSPPSTPGPSPSDTRPMTPPYSRATTFFSTFSSVFSDNALVMRCSKSRSFIIHALGVLASLPYTTLLLFPVASIRRSLLSSDTRVVAVIFIFLALVMFSIGLPLLKLTPARSAVDADASALTVGSFWLAMAAVTSMLAIWGDTAPLDTCMTHL